MNEDELALLRLLIENLDEFRAVTTETFKVLHAKMKLDEAHIGELRHLVWGILAVLCIIVLILVIATIAAMARR